MTRESPPTRRRWSLSAKGVVRLQAKTRPKKNDAFVILCVCVCACVCACSCGFVCVKRNLK